MTPLEMNAKASANFAAAKAAKQTWVIGKGGNVLYEMESEAVAKSFLTRWMVKQGYAVYKA